MTTHPKLESIVHVAVTAIHLETSVAWYERVLGLERVITVPHAGGEGVVLATPDRKVWWAIHRHDDADGQPFSELRTGLDHVGLLVPTYDDLLTWVQWLDDLGVPHESIKELPDFGMAALIFRDPDGIPLELLAFAG